MFDKESCNQCGFCLMSCPYTNFEKIKAEQEIIKLLENREYSELVQNCLRCGYCDTVCPTGSNPSELILDIIRNQNEINGIQCLPLYSNKVPLNFMIAGLEFEKKNKLEHLKICENPPKAKVAFYIGCSMTYIFMDLAKTSLLEDLPIIGGMEYCCGGYVYNNFNEKEIIIKGKQFLDKLNRLGIKKLITFCPSCDRMLQYVYPRLIDEFSIECQTISEYLLEKYQSYNPENKKTDRIKLAFHDPCHWRHMNNKVLNAPRELLNRIGFKIAEMKHNRESTMCCGASMLLKDPEKADQIALLRINEAKDAGANAIVVNCTACLSLSKTATEHNMQVFHIMELAQALVGESPLHRFDEIRNHLMATMAEKISCNPEILNQKFTIENGEIKQL